MFNNLSSRGMYGGFFLGNIEDWILEKCRETGAPEIFFRAIREVIDSIEDRLEDGEDVFNLEKENEEIDDIQT